MEENTNTSAEVGSNPVSDFQAIHAITGGNNAILVLLVLCSLVGGKAGWSFWNKLLEKKHEQKMKELAIKDEALDIEKEKVLQKGKRKRKG